MKKVVSITGASSGIGKSTTNQLLSEGYIICGAARRIDKMSDLKDAGAQLLNMDVTDDSSMVEGLDQIITNQGRIDVLINNAGYGSLGLLKMLRSAGVKSNLKSITKGEETAITEVNGLTLTVKRLIKEG